MTFSTFIGSSSWTPTGDYLLDWNLTGADGSATLSSSTGSQDVTVSVSTPTNGDWDSFVLAGGKLYSNAVHEPTVTEINFDLAVSNVNFQLEDIDQGLGWDDQVTVLAYDADGNLVEVEFSGLDASHSVDDNSVEGGANLDGFGDSSADNVTVSIAGPITKLVIVHDNGSDAHLSGEIKITDLGFDCAEADEGDGIVEGTASDDLIDMAYTGDPDGDMVDNGDALLPGEVGDDDIIVAGDGNDTVLAGEGNDEVYAGGGDDTVDGGAGDDLIYGDSDGGHATGGHREVFQWDQAPGYGDEHDASGFTQDTGSVQVTFSVVSESCGADVEYEEDANNVAGIHTGDLPAADPNSGLAMEGNGGRDDSEIALDFSQPVENVEFRINDIDMDSSVRVVAYDADGNEIPVTLTAGSNVALSDTDSVPGADTGTATGGNLPPSSDENSMLVQIAGPVASVHVIHDILGDDTSHIQLSDVYYDVPGDDPGAPGNDTLYGGAGDDEIHGEEGDDLIHGDSGDDAGDHREVFQWDEGPDYSDERDVSGFTQNTGSVEVTFKVESMTGNSDVEYEDKDTNVSDLDTGDLPPADPNSGLGMENNGAGDASEISLGFSEPVENVEFRINDVDVDSRVQVIAYDADGNAIPVTLTAGRHVELSDTDGVPGADTATATGGNQPATADGNSVLVQIAGPVVSIHVIHDVDGTELSNIQLSDVYFDAPGGGDSGDDGDDVLYGGDGDDVIYGDGGDDFIDGGAGVDTVYGGDDRDTFVNVNVGDVVDGNEGGDDWDTLDLTGSAPTDGSLHVTYTTPDHENGYVTFFDEDHNSVGTMDFYNIENIVPCFTPGTMIATPSGERPVEELKTGDRVITRDNGIQEIRWIGAKPMDWRALASNQHLKPVLIRAGALGNGLPERDMMVSPNHRILVANDRTALFFEEREVLASAKHLVDNRGIQRVDTMGTTYIHFMFDHHEVVLSNGAWTESFQPGDYSLKGIDNSQRQELFELFPELETREGIEDFAAARRVLKKHEARLLVAQ